MNKLLKGLIIGLAALGTFAVSSHAGEGKKAAVDVSGYVGVVSNYIFRGLPVTGPAVQGSLDLSFAAVPGLKVGAWLSSAVTDRGNNAGNETDYYISYGSGDDKFSWQVGWMGYSFDFNRFGDDPDPEEDAGVGVENELFFGIGMRGFTFDFFLVNAQASTKGTNEEDADTEGGPYTWLALGYDHDMSDYTLGFSLETGDYSSRGNAGVEAQNAMLLITSLSKDINESTSVSFNRQFVLSEPEDHEIRDQFWFGVDFAY